MNKSEIIKQLELTNRIADLNANKVHKLLLELEKKNEKISRLTKAKEDFFISITHDLRTPLNGIIGFITLLDKSSLNAQQKKWASHILTSAQYLLSLVNQILENAQKESNENNEPKTQMHLVQLLQNIQKIYTPIAELKGIKFKSKFDITTRVAYDFNEIKLTQILNNLLSNALKYTQKGQVHFHVKHQNNALVMRIKDTGRGIAKKLLEQFNKHHFPKNAGHGFGIQIASTTTTDLDGKITFDSEIKKGTCVTVTLPCTITEVQETIVPAKKDNSTKSLVASKIMIVDDNTLNNTLLYDYFSSKNIVAECFENPVTALHRLGQFNPDIIISDLLMKPMDGIAFFHELSKTSLPKHFILATATATKKQIVEWKKLGIYEVLLKPIDFTILDALIQTPAKNTRSKSKIPSSILKIFKTEEKALDFLAKAKENIHVNEMQFNAFMQEEKFAQARGIAHILKSNYKLIENFEKAKFYSKAEKELGKKQ